MTIQEGIEIPDPEQPEEMMSLSLDTGMKIQDIEEKVDQLHIKDEEDNNMTLMQTTDRKIQETIPKEEIEDKMYKEDRQWNMEESTEWNDEYVITIGEEVHKQDIEDEDEAEAMMLTNLECETLKRFLIQEAAEKPKVFCKDCSKRQCISCDNLRSKYSEEDQETYKKMWDNVNLIEHKGKTRVKATYLYRNPPEESFSPENSNMKAATSRTDMIINRLIKKDQLKQFQENRNWMPRTNPRR
jgi:hypothetical protein